MSPTFNARCNIWSNTKTNNFRSKVLIMLITISRTWSYHSWSYMLSTERRHKQSTFHPLSLLLLFKKTFIIHSAYMPASQLQSSFLSYSLHQSADSSTHVKDKKLNIFQGSSVAVFFYVVNITFKYASQKLF